MPILALGVSDTSLGPNSPIGFVLKHPTNKEGQIKINNFGQPEQGGQWVVYSITLVRGPKQIPFDVQVESSSSVIVRDCLFKRLKAWAVIR